MTTVINKGNVIIEIKEGSSISDDEIKKPIKIFTAKNGPKR